MKRPMCLSRSDAAYLSLEVCTLVSRRQNDYLKAPFLSSRHHTRLKWTFRQDTRDVNTPLLRSNFKRQSCYLIQQPSHMIRPPLHWFTLLPPSCSAWNGFKGTRDLFLFSVLGKKKPCRGIEALGFSQLGGGRGAKESSRSNLEICEGIG